MGSQARARWVECDDAHELRFEARTITRVAAVGMPPARRMWLWRVNAMRGPVSLDVTDYGRARSLEAAKLKVARLLRNADRRRARALREARRG